MSPQAQSAQLDAALAPATYPDIGSGKVPAAKKRRTTKAVETVAAPTEEPPLQHPADAYVFRCVFPHGKLLATAMARAGSLCKSVVIDLTQADGLVIRQEDAFHVCRVSLELPKEAWLAWVVPRGGHVIVLFYEQLVSLAGLAGPEHSLTLYGLRDQQDYVWARLHSTGKTERRYRLSCWPTDNLEDIAPVSHTTWPFPWRVRLPSRLFREEISRCEAAKAGFASFSVRGDGKLVLTTFPDELARMPTTYDAAIPVTELVQPAAAEAAATAADASLLVRFAVSFLSIIGKMDDMSSVLTLAGGLPDKPLVFTYPVPRPGAPEQTLGHITCMLMNKQD